MIETKNLNNHKPLTLEQLVDRQRKIIKVIDILFVILKRNDLISPEDIEELAKQNILTITK